MTKSAKPRKFQSFNETLDALEEPVRESLGSALRIHHLDALEWGLFDEWLSRQRYDDLIDYLIDRYGDGEGNALIVELGYVLEEKGDLERIDRLYGSLVKSRVKAFWRNRKGLRDPFHPEHAGGIEQIVSYKSHAIWAISEYGRLVWVLGDEDRSRQLHRLEHDLYFDRKSQNDELVTPAEDSRQMTEVMFWELVESARTGVASCEDFAEKLTVALTAFKPKEIREFERILRHQHASLWDWDLWALAYIVNAGCSDDAFDYFRAWIIAQGRKTFEAALLGATPLAEVIEECWDLECEELLYVASAAFEEKTGDEMPAVRNPKTVKRGKRWKETELKVRYPELCKRFWNDSPTQAKKATPRKVQPLFAVMQAS